MHESSLFSPPYHTKKIYAPSPFETMKADAQSIINHRDESEKAKSQLYGYLEALKRVQPSQLDQDFVSTLSLLVKALLECTNNDMLVAETSRRICSAYECFKEFINQQTVTSPILELHLHYIHSLNCLDRSSEAKELCLSLLPTLSSVNLPAEKLVSFENELKQLLVESLL